jgi:hypothetical protein
MIDRIHWGAWLKCENMLGTSGRFIENDGVRPVLPVVAARNAKMFFFG